MTEEVPRPVRFRDSMPKPVLVAFVLVVAGAVAAIVLGLVLIPRGTIALQSRRPPPRSVFTHDVGPITPAPLPSVIPTVAPACPEYARTRLVAGGDGIARLRSILQLLCKYTRGGLGDDVTRAARALDGVTIEFGRFSATGVESTADLGARIMWINAKFALRKTPVEDVAPVVLHEAWHLFDAAARVTAEQELRARAVELSACRNLIAIKDWPRGCKDASTLMTMERARAVELLVSAGYGG
ncbi:MAG: hypothetical protein ABR552_08600 [Actinomycetota bacterium]